MRPMGDQTHDVYEPQCPTDRFGSFAAPCGAAWVTAAFERLAVVKQRVNAASHQAANGRGCVKTQF